MYYMAESAIGQGEANAAFWLAISSAEHTCKSLVGGYTLTFTDLTPVEQILKIFDPVSRS